MTLMPKGRRVAGMLCVAIAAGLAASGCAVLLVSAGAAGGYALSKDSVTDQYDASPDVVFGHALRVMEDLGAVELKDRDKGLIKGNVESAEITVTIKSLTKHTVELKVKARDLLELVPKVDVAQRVYSAINDRIK